MSAKPDPYPFEDRRKNRRLTGECRARVIVEGGEMLGRTENLSHKDMLLFTDDEIRVTVELMSDGVVKCVPGRLVRHERLENGGSGWAVEFLV